MINDLVNNALRASEVKYTYYVVLYVIPHDKASIANSIRVLSEACIHEIPHLASDQ